MTEDTSADKMLKNLKKHNPNYAIAPEVNLDYIGEDDKTEHLKTEDLAFVSKKDSEVRLEAKYFNKKI